MLRSTIRQILREAKGWWTERSDPKSFANEDEDTCRYFAKGFSGTDEYTNSHVEFEFEFISGWLDFDESFIFPDDTEIGITYRACKIICNTIPYYLIKPTPSQIYTMRNNGPFWIIPDSVSDHRNWSDKLCIYDADLW